MEVLNTTRPTVSDSTVSNSKICSIPCSSSETNNIVSSDTSSRLSVYPLVSSASLLDSNQPDSSIFIPAPDPRGFDGGDMLRMKR